MDAAHGVQASIRHVALDQREFIVLEPVATLRGFGDALDGDGWSPQFTIVDRPRAFELREISPESCDFFGRGVHQIVAVFEQPTSWTNQMLLFATRQQLPTIHLLPPPTSGARSTAAT